MVTAADPICSPDSGQPAKVLVVDDSAFMRYTITRYLENNLQIRVVGTARNGIEALDLIPKLNPDVVTLDVEMPNLDGISTLREIMTRFPRPVIMLSSLTQEGSVETIQALMLGAVDFVAKPSQKTNINEVMDEVAGKILKAVCARVKPILSSTREGLKPATTDLGKSVLRPYLRNDPLVVIGASTGGPRALNVIIPALPVNFPAAVVVVQHMPAGFTHSLADRLNSLSHLWVKEAAPGDHLEIGKVLLAPGGFHMLFDERDQVCLNQRSPVHGVRPAVDVTLTSIVEHHGKAVTAIILTGMGNDGTNATILLHSLGGNVIAEHESTCVVYGMPRSVVEAGAADQIVRLEDIASALDKKFRQTHL